MNITFEPSILKMQSLQNMIANAETQADIPHDMSLSIFELSKELIAETVQQVEMIVKQHKALVEKYQAQKEDHAQLLKHADAMAENLMYRELTNSGSLYLKGNA